MYVESQFVKICLTCPRIQRNANRLKNNYAFQLVPVKVRISALSWIVEGLLYIQISKGGFDLLGPRGQGEDATNDVKHVECTDSIGYCNAQQVGVWASPWF